MAMTDQRVFSKTLILRQVTFSESYKILLKSANFTLNFSTFLAAFRYELQIEKNSLVRYSLGFTDYESSKEYGSKSSVLGEEGPCLSRSQGQIVLWLSSISFLKN